MNAKPLLLLAPEILFHCRQSRVRKFAKTKQVHGQTNIQQSEGEKEAEEEEEAQQEKEQRKTEIEQN